MHSKSGQTDELRVFTHVRRGSVVGRRICHMPGDRDYERTRISTSRGERYFCTEAEARAAGWRRATQGFPLYFSNCCRFVDFQILPSFEPPSPVGDYCSPSVRLKLCFFDPVSECFENRHHLVDRDSSLRFAFRVVQISRRRVIPSVTFSAVPPMIGAGCCSWCLAERAGPRGLDRDRDLLSGIF